MAFEVSLVSPYRSKLGCLRLTHPIPTTEVLDVDVGSNKTAEVTYADLEADSDSSLGLASEIYREPCHYGWQSSIRSRSYQEEPKVTDARRRVCELNDETDDAEPLIYEEEEEALLPSICEN